jgi:hypothetical protein
VFLLYDAERVKREADVFLAVAYPRRVEFRFCLFLFYIFLFFAVLWIPSDPKRLDLLVRFG